MIDLEKKQEIARENGKKSKGPITPEGKKRSSLNGITHGLASKCVVLANESQEAYDALLVGYQNEWQPASLTESDLLLDMVNARWRLHRIRSLETALFDSEMFCQKEEFEAAWIDHHPAMRVMDAMCAVAVENPVTLETLQRYETRYSRLYNSSMDQLIKLRRLRHAPEIAPALPTPPLHPEPQPEAQHLESTPQPQSPANWLTRLLAFLLSFVASLRPARRKTTQKHPRKMTEPTSFLQAPWWTFYLPEFFSWIATYIDKNAQPDKEQPVTLPEHSS